MILKNAIFTSGTLLKRALNLLHFHLLRFDLSLFCTNTTLTSSFEMGNDLVLKHSRASLCEQQSKSSCQYQVSYCLFWKGVLFSKRKIRFCPKRESFASSHELCFECTIYILENLLFGCFSEFTYIFADKSSGNLNLNSCQSLLCKYPWILKLSYCSRWKPTNLRFSKKKKRATNMEKSKV